MNRLFSKMIDKYMPKVNADVMNGLSCVYMKSAEQYIHKVFISASKSFPASLTYEGFERCSPYEEYDETTRLINNKRTYDLAKSNTYLVKYLFKFNGEFIVKHMSLLYVEDAGIFSLGGSMFHITPVLSDKVISPSSDSIFVRLLRDKIIFKRCYHTVIINNKRETTHVVWSQIYRKAKEAQKVVITTRALTSIAHYLFAKYGVDETFQKYCGFKPVVGEDEINTDNYPESDWYICETSYETGKIKPKSFIGDYYTSTKIKVAIPKEFWNPLSKALVIGLFYIIDHFPTRFKPSYLNNCNLYKILLGHIVFSGVYGEGKLFSNIDEHFTSLDDYVDGIIIDKLKENNYHIHDFYDLLSLILGNFNNLVLDSNKNINSMYGKSLEILYYVFYDITSGIFKVSFRLNKLATKKILNIKDVKETFNRYLKPGAIFKLTSGKIISETVAYSGDHKYPKFTSKLTEQESSVGGSRGKSKRLVVSEDQHVDPSMPECGSLLFLSKANPTPTNRINPFISLEAGTIIPNPKYADIRDDLERQLKGLNIVNSDYIPSDTI